MDKKATMQRGSVLDTWHMYAPEERCNIAIYIFGIMLYKFGLEAFNGSIIAQASNRYDNDATMFGHRNRTFERIGLLTGLNQACQCVGSILIAPLIKRYPTKNVLSCAIIVFGALTAVILIVDATTGGCFKPPGADSEDFSYYGNWNTDGLIPIYCVTGVAYGMVELIRRVIPRDIVGGNVQKLTRMDSVVHIFYEIAGTAGAFCTALGLIPYFRNNMSFIITPICFACASVVWFFITNLHFVKPAGLERSERRFTGYLQMIGRSVYLFGLSAYSGAYIVFSSRKFIWLLPGYAFALYGHRYLENAIGPIIARRYLGNSAWSQIMVGGSNAGELLGALAVFLFTNMVHTPMPWLRLDALCLLIVWYLPFYCPARNQVGYAWIVAATFVPISYGWAAGDVSLAAYIQASFARLESKTKDVSALAAVMSFLYSTYVVLYAVLNPLLGRYIDNVFTASGQTSVRPAVYNVAGVQFTVLCIIMLISTFVPKGAFSFNPQNLYGEALDSDVDGFVDHGSSDDEKKDGLLRKSSAVASLEDAPLPEEPSGVQSARRSLKVTR
ncbi:Putative MFS transporter superfamily [Septoria linicola]|uniref:MFS transporter superfamily n=1 Tax=Septoria linicola TaxID=215465 RepID=A0A9Q9EDI1_9PEZI|nr:Putative MFS transporter superfamily [Septoria linicola]